jgi:hypothetical protein
MDIVNFTEGQLWRCQNDACGSEILVTVSSQLKGELPRCTCGSIMRIVEREPGLRSREASELSTARNKR